MVKPFMGSSLNVKTLQADLLYKLYPARKEMIWLDDLPLAVIQSRKAGGPSEIFFIHSDHLNQPQRITDTAGLVAWERSQLPFGEDWQDPQPAVELSQPGVITQAAYLANQALFTGTAIDFNLRFPGQYADPETQLNQNWFRDYDPTTGRYIQSDPIGLNGGINTYAYTGGNPVSRIDPTGLIQPGTLCTLTASYEITSERGPIFGYPPYKRVRCLYYCGSNQECSQNPADDVIGITVEGRELIPGTFRLTACLPYYYY